MITVIGLGNPGTKYEHHRHNVGFQVFDAFAAQKSLHFNERKLLEAMIAPVSDELLLAKPTTFMNESGRCARQIVRNHDTSIVVVYDDIDIPIGTVKCSFDRGAGGHNGVQSIIDHLGTMAFARIRVGVRPVHEELLSRIAPPDGFQKFLLSDFAPFESELREQGIQKAIEIINLLPKMSFEEIMNRYN